MKTRLIVGFLCGLLSVSAMASASYLCVTDMATGFAFDKSRKQWRSVDFKAERKYRVSKAAGHPQAWEVKEVGDDFVMARDKDGFNEAGTLVGQGSFHQFYMNEQNLRFLLISLSGYWTDNIPGFTGNAFKEGANTPSMAIGKCSPL